MKAETRKVQTRMRVGTKCDEQATSKSDGFREKKVLPMGPNTLTALENGERVL